MLWRGVVVRFERGDRKDGSRAQCVLDRYNDTGMQTEM